MSVNVAINGFGRIGRQVLKGCLNNKAFNFVAINDLTDTKTLLHLFKYDSIHGRTEGDFSCDNENLYLNGHKIKITSEKDPSKLPWKEMKIDIVLESTGLFTKKADAVKHIEAGAKKVVISAPAKEEDITVVMGVNEKLYDTNKHNVISNASCTTNCLAPIAKVLLDNFGIEKALMTTIHSYTNDQKILDLPHKDLRRARAAALSMIPTTTGAAKAVSLVIPELKGKMDGIAIRVPTPNVSLVDLTVLLKNKATPDAINLAVKTAAETNLKNIVEYCTEPLVSCDFNGRKVSGIFDSLSTMVTNDNLAKIFIWYDNETGYSYRTIDLLQLIAEKL